MRATGTPLLERAPIGGPQLEILDTNAIFNDLVYQLRHNREVGVLIRSAREGAIRLFAPTHVLEEVLTGAVTQEPRGFSSEELLALFGRRYLPEISFVDVSGIPIGARAQEVAVADLDDLPTAQLALLLAPCHVYTDDPDLTEAGFGQARNWLSLTRSAERTMQVDRTMLVAAELMKWAWVKLRPRAQQHFRELQPTEVLIGSALGIAVLMVLSPAGHAQLNRAMKTGAKVLAGAGEVTASAGLGLLGERVRHSGYLTQTMVRPEATPSLEQRIARELALRGPLSPSYLAVACGVELATVEACLLERACFVPGKQGWHLGRRFFLDPPSAP